MRIITNKPVAIDSLDHIKPQGARYDNSISETFNRRLYELIPIEHVRLLDIGCAGGGLVKSILYDGGFAVGIDGSDYSRVHKRAAWETLDGVSLFTADVTEEFAIGDEIHDLWNDFNVVTAWEFFEHIAEDKIKAVCDNILNHMAEDAFFVGSICDAAMEHHVTLHNKAWWYAKFAECGLKESPRIEQHFESHRVRYEGFCVGLERS